MQKCKNLIQRQGRAIRLKSKNCVGAVKIVLTPYCRDATTLDRGRNFASLRVALPLRIGLKSKNLQGVPSLVGLNN